MHWELWEARSNNLVETFDSEGEGLQAVHEMLAVNAPDLIESLGLGAMYDEGEPHDAELPPALYGETLKARLVEFERATNLDASREVHQKIRRWLKEEGINAEDRPDPASTFNLLVRLRTGVTVNV